MKFTIVLCLLVLTIQYKGKSLFSFLASMKEDNKDTKEAKDSKSSDDSLEEWISISSSTFKSEQIYPPLSISSKRTSKLKVNSSNFLINQFYKKDSKDESLPKEKTSFFARLNPPYLSISSSKNSTILLGFNIKSLITQSSISSSKFCFDAISSDDKEYTLCFNSNKSKFKFVCAINAIIKQSIPECIANATINDTSSSTPETVIDINEYEPIILIPQQSPYCNADWNYNNKGNDWECICKEGKEQSPIDLDKSGVIESDIAPLFTFNSLNVEDKLSVTGQVLEKKYLQFEYQGNALKIFAKNFAKITTMNGAVFEGQEIAFHTPAEHTINGKKFDMEMEITYFGKSVGDIDKQVVLSFLFKKKPGVFNAFLDDLIEFGLPNSVNTKTVIMKNLYIPKIQYDTEYKGEYVLKPFSFFTYQGSISHPPCTERTIRYVVSDPIPISGITLAQFEEALRIPNMQIEGQEGIGGMVINDIDGTIENNRATQPLGERSVFFWDHTKYCDSKQEVHVAPKQEGHFEKISRKATQYYYVNTPEPTGLPGAFVIDEKEAKGK